MPRIKNIIKRAFTLTELMVALAIIAVLTAVMIPIMHKLRPNQEVLMAKRAYNLTQTVVSEMANDTRCYPILNYNEKAIFNNGQGYARCQQYDNTEHQDANNKFIEIFTNLANLHQQVDGIYTSKDGTSWSFASELEDGGTGRCSNYMGIDITLNPLRNNSHHLIMQVCSTAKIMIYDSDYNDDNAYQWVIDAIKVDRRLVGE